MPSIPHTTRDYEEAYRARLWAYGDKPDPDLIKALVGLPRGKALDLGAGQGRHALALSALGFDVTVVDTSAEGLHQATAAAEERGLPIHVLQGDAAKYEPDDVFRVVVASLFLHIPARRTSLQIAKRIGAALASNGLFYLSFPGYTKETQTLARDLIEAAGCAEEWIVKHLVTRKERPRLQVPRRNETRALGRAPKRR